MLQSRLFTKTRSQPPSDEESVNARLLIRAGFIHKEMSGVYSFLPLGFRVLKKIENIIREEMNALGAEEVLLTALQKPDVWEASGRWDDKVIDIWFKTALKNGSLLGLANTHEEAITALARQYVSSYRDLPFSVYQIQTKFRNELRARSGILRGREFLMKDLYSFHLDTDNLDKFYDRVSAAYEKIFSRLDIGDVTYRAFASGGAFSKYSHEFQTETDAGEDVIHICASCRQAVNDEIKGDLPACPACGGGDFRRATAIEVGNIFKLGTRFSEAANLAVADADGQNRFVVMGSYGLGLSRLLGTIVETHHDDRGIIWPAAVSPASAHLLSLGDDKATMDAASSLYRKLSAAGVDTLFDDRANVSAGAKFADADLIGLPYRLVVSPKSGDRVEFKPRRESEPSLLSASEVVTRLTS